jgi:RNA polymerase-binding transcription factor DksA
MSASRIETLQESARRALLTRRNALIAQRDAADRGAQELLDENEPDWEDRAANVAAARGLAALGENERAQLTMVQTALRRIDEGTWGWCIACGSPIDEARLRVAPEAPRCARCTNHH